MFLNMHVLLHSSGGASAHSAPLLPMSLDAMYKLMKVYFETGVVLKQSKMLSHPSGQS